MRPWALAFLGLGAAGCGDGADSAALPEGDASSIDASSDVTETSATDASSIDAAADGSDAIDGNDAPVASCATDLDCACGSVCKAGKCLVSDCSTSECPTGRTCACKAGVLDIDGRTGPQWAKLGDPDVVLRRRPLTSADPGDLLLRNYFVHDVTDQKAVHVSAYCPGGGGDVAYRDVTLSCLEIARVFRDDKGAAAGLHMDYIKVDGCAGVKNRNVLVQDVNIHDGNVYSLVSDTNIDVLTLRRVRQVDAGGSFQIGGKTLAIGEVHLEESPGLGVAFIDDKVGHAWVKKSKGMTGLKGAPVKVIYEDAESCPSPARALDVNECCVTSTTTCLP